MALFDLFDDFEIENKIKESVEIECSRLKTNDSIIIDSHPCIIKNLKQKQTKECGNPNLIIIGTSYWSGKDLQLITPLNNTVISPIIKKCQYYLESLDDQTGYVTLEDLSGNTRADIKLVEERPQDYNINKLIKDGLNKNLEIIVTVLSTLGYDKIINCKILKSTKKK